MDQASSLKNSFLIALPSLGDPHFSKTVTYICEHDDHGAMGLVLNRPYELLLQDVLEHMNISHEPSDIDLQPVYTGGPVETERGFVLHSSGSAWDSTLQLSEHLCVTTSRDILEALAAGKGPEKSFLALGYAGWAAGQLDYELQQDTWISGPADPGIIFDTPSESRWEAAARLLGVDVHLISSVAGHA